MPSCPESSLLAFGASLCKEPSLADLMTDVVRQGIDRSLVARLVHAARCQGEADERARIIELIKGELAVGTRKAMVLGLKK